ncbi:hypothetical protein [Streptomyces niveus]|uniref:hypothetical protein n=1 Tax=Streptomyces niveus TaxID=193462 RepID=UPI003642CC94
MPDTHPEDLIRQLRSLAEDFADVHHLTLCTGLLDDDATLMPLIARIRTTQTLTNKAITLTLAAGDSTIGPTAAGRRAIEHLTGAARHGNNAGGHLLKGIPAATALHPRPPQRPAPSPDAAHLGQPPRAATAHRRRHRPPAGRAGHVSRRRRARHRRPRHQQHGCRP